MTRGNLPLFPQEAKIQPQEVKDWMKLVQDDIYPQTQVFTPTISGLSANPGPVSITGGSNRIIGPMWAVAVIVSGGSIASGAYFDLPFNVKNTAVFSVRFEDGSGKMALCDINEKRVYLPDWTTTGRVVINGMVGG